MTTTHAEILRAIEETMRQQERKDPALAAKQARLLSVLESDGVNTGIGRGKVNSKEFAPNHPFAHSQVTFMPKRAAEAAPEPTPAKPATKRKPRVRKPAK